MNHRHFISGLIAFVLAAGAGCKSGDKQQTEVPTTQDKGMTTQSVEIDYTVPEGWIVQQPATSMRKAQFSLPGVDGEEAAELAVFYFPGAGGGVDDNLNRWYAQFKQSDGSATKDHVDRHETEVNGLNVTIVYVTGTYLKSRSPMMMSGPVDEMPDYALLAAIAETAGSPWFFKTTGPRKTIQHWRAAFDEFVKSFELKKPAV